MIGGNGIPYDAIKPCSTLMILTTSFSVLSSSMYSRLIVGMWVFHSKVDGPCLCFPCRMTGRPCWLWFGAIIAVPWHAVTGQDLRASRLRAAELKAVSVRLHAAASRESPQVAKQKYRNRMGLADGSPLQRVGMLRRYQFCAGQERCEMEWHVKEI